MTNTSREPYRPILTTDAAITTMWRTIINPLGWHLRRFYLVLVDDHGRPDPHIVEIDEIPDAFDRADADRVAEFLRRRLDGLGLAGGGSVAVLACRPGAGQLLERDRELCRHVYDAARAAGLRLQLLHVGTDTEIVPVPMDELLPRTA